MQETKLNCPACGHELAELTAGDVTVDACRSGCGGVWFDNGELSEVDDPEEQAGESVTDVPEKWASAIDQSRKRACPRCDGVVMFKRFFSPREEVEIDECPGCGGIWLDAGELERIRAQYDSREAREAAVNTQGTLATLSIESDMKQEQRRTRSRARFARFTGHLWHDYNLGHFRGREWPPWRGSLDGWLDDPTSR